MTRPLAVLAPVACAAALVAALTGCAPGPHPAPASSGSASTPAPLVTGRAADTSVPQPALDLDCAHLFALPAFNAAYGPGILHPVDVLTSQGLTSADIPDADVLQTVGGISCDWSNGVPAPTSADDAATDPVEVTLSILPNAATQWSRFDPSQAGVQCYAPSASLNCWSNQLMGTTWIELNMLGVGGDPEAHALSAAVAAAVSAAGPGAAAWTPPSGTTTFGDCMQLLTPAQVAGDLGITGTGISFTTDDGGWSIREAARAEADAVGCQFQYGDNVVGNVLWLRGGAWAHDAALAASAPGWGTPAAAAIAGLASGDRATVRCNAPDPAADEFAPVCTVDLLLGGNWLQVVIAPYPGVLPGTPDPRAAALAVATHLVAGYNAHAH